MARFATTLALAAAAASLALGGCQSLKSVRLKDDGQAKVSAAALTAVKGADVVKVYDDQLARLKTLAAQEDLAVAGMMVGQRDAKFAAVLGPPSPRQRSDLIVGAARIRLSELRANGQPSINFESILLNRLGDLRAAERTLEYEQGEFGRVRVSGDKRVTVCGKLANPVPATQWPVADSQLQRVVNACGSVQASQQAIDDHYRNSAASSGGLLWAAFTAWQDAVARGDAPPPPAAGGIFATISAEIAAADAAAKADPVKALMAFRGKLAGHIETLTPGAKFLALDHAERELDGLLKGTLCADKTKLSPEVLAEAGCDSAVAGGVQGKTTALWAFTDALAALAAANDPRMRSAEWLSAAKSIVGAQKADALAEKKQAEQDAANLKARYLVLAREASLLGEILDLEVHPAKCRGQVLWACMMPIYVESWNAGAIPAEVFRYRGGQIYRDYGTRRAKVATERQVVLLTAAAGAIDAHAQSGIEPKAIAQALFDIGLILAVD